MIDGVSKDAPVVKNANGGKQSEMIYSFNLIPPRAIFEVARIIKNGADRYEEDPNDPNYLKLSVNEHVNHALMHLYAYLNGDNTDDHMAHAATRMLFALEVDKRSVKDESI
jgi:hypothetical protein